MYLNIFIVLFLATMYTLSAQFTTQDPPIIDSSQLGSCNKENQNRHEVVKDKSGADEILYVCSEENGVYAWKMKTIDDTNDGVMENVMNDVMLKREEATTFYERDRRSIDHECYEECCKWEEVRESFKHNLDLGYKYWAKYNAWKSENGCTKSGWSW